MPAAISGTETIRMPPPSVVNVFIQCNFHTIRSLLGYDTSYGIRYINLYHIPLLLQRMLELFKTSSGSRGKESEGFRTTQLPGYYFTYTETSFTDSKQIFCFIQISTGYEKTKRGEVTASTRPSTPRTSFSTASSGTASAYPIVS